MCSLTNEFTIDNKSENNLRYSKVFLHHYYLLWIFFSFSAALVLTTYHLKPMLTAACTNLFKSIEMTPMIKSFRQICMYLHNFISFSFFFFLIFKFTQPQVRIIYNKTPSVQAHNGHANMTIFFFL